MLNFLQTEPVENLIVPDSVQKARFAEAVRQIADMDMREIWSQMLEWCIWTGVKIIIALLIFYVARWILGRVVKVLDAVMTRREVEVSLHSFLLTAIKTVGYVLIFVILVSVLGFDSSAFIAILASMGLAIGMALSGTLQNFAGGIMLLVLRPYRVGDYIEAQGVSGTVYAIRLFTTIIHTTDKKTIYIPNNVISTSIINNYSTSTTRRCSWRVSVQYGSDFEQIRATLMDIISHDKRILSEPSPVVRIDALAESAVVVEARVWVLNSDYWDVYDSVNEIIYKRLPEQGIHFAYPQLDVHLREQK